jgi:hypothetical protein
MSNCGWFDLDWEHPKIALVDEEIQSANLTGRGKMFLAQILRPSNPLCVFPIFERLNKLKSRMKIEN